MIVSENHKISNSVCGNTTQLKDQTTSSVFWTKKLFFGTKFITLLLLSFLIVKLKPQTYFFCWDTPTSGSMQCVFLSSFVKMNFPSPYLLHASDGFSFSTLFNFVGIFHRPPVHGLPRCTWSMNWMDYG